jgi:ABC-type Fe3+-hydroxamate transport system substrate-binding protein
MKLIDAIGQEHQPVPRDGAPRIVSLVPSITELLCDLGLAPFLAGRTGFCIHPAETVRAIPKVGGTKDVNIDKIRRLAPTHLVVNIDENEKPTVDELAQFVPHVVVTHPLVSRDNL